MFIQLIKLIIIIKYSVLNKTYMYINFQQNRVSRSVITVHTNVFAKNHKLH